MRGSSVHMLLLFTFVTRSAASMTGAAVGGCDAQLKSAQSASLFEEQDKSVTTLLLQSGLEFPAASFVGESNPQPFGKQVLGAFEPTVINSSMAMSQMQVGLETLARHPERASSMFLLEQSSQVHVHSASATVPLLVIAIVMTLLIVATAAAFCYRFRFDKDGARGESRHYRRMSHASETSLKPYEVYERKVKASGSGSDQGDRSHGSGHRSGSNASVLGIGAAQASLLKPGDNRSSISSSDNTHTYESSQSPHSDASSCASGDVPASNSIIVNHLLPWINEGGCLEIHGHFPIPKLYARIVSKIEGRFLEIATTPQWLTPHVGFGPLADGTASPSKVPIKAIGPTREMFGELKMDGGKMSIVSDGYEIMSFKEAMHGEPWLAKFKSRSGSTLASVWLTAKEKHSTGRTDDSVLMQFCVGSGIDNALIIACMLGAVVSFPHFGRQLKALRPRMSKSSSESSFNA